MDTPKIHTDAIDVGYVAHLARLALTPEETALYQGQLSHVLDYVQTLKELDVDGIEPTTHPRPVFNVFRDDEPRDSQPRDKTLQNAPRSADGLFVLPRIVE